MKPSLPLVNDLLYAGRVLTEGWYGQIDHAGVKESARLRSIEQTAVASKLRGGWYKRQDSNSSNSSTRSNLSHHSNEIKGTSRNSMLTPRRTVSGTSRMTSSRRSTDMEQAGNLSRRLGSGALGSEQCTTPRSRRGSAAADAEAQLRRSRSAAAAAAAAGATSAAMAADGEHTSSSTGAGKCSAGVQPATPRRARRHSLAIMESSAALPIHSPRHSRSGPDDDRPSSSGSSRSPSRRRASMHMLGGSNSGRSMQAESPRSPRVRRHSTLVVEVGSSSSRAPEFAVTPSSTSSRRTQRRSCDASEQSSPRRRSSMGQGTGGLSGGGSSNCTTPRAHCSSRDGGGTEQGRCNRGAPRRPSLLVTSSSDYQPPHQAADGESPVGPTSSSSSSRPWGPATRRHSLVMEGYAGNAGVVTEESPNSPRSPRSPQTYSPREGVSRSGRARRFSLPLQFESRASLLGPSRGPGGDADLGFTPHQQLAGNDSPRRLSAASDLAACTGRGLAPSTSASRPRRASVLSQHLSSLLPEGSRYTTEGGTSDAGSNLGSNHCSRRSSVAVAEDAGATALPITSAMHGNGNSRSSTTGAKGDGQTTGSAAAGEPGDNAAGCPGGSSSTIKPPAGQKGRRPISVIIPGSDALLSGSSGDEGGGAAPSSAAPASPFAAAANTASSSTWEEGWGAAHTPSTSCTSPRRVAMMQRMQRLVTGAGNSSMSDSLRGQTSSDLQQALGLAQEAEGRIKVRPVYGEVSQFTPNGVLLDNGDYVPADLVVHCTGFVKSYDWLDGPSRVSQC
jgi:hypothetical protein